MGGLKVHVKSAYKPSVPSGLPLSSVSVAWSDLKYFYSTLNGVLVYHRATLSIKFASTHLYTWVERGTVGVICLAQENNTMSPAKAQTRATLTLRSACLSQIMGSWTVLSQSRLNSITNLDTLYQSCSPGESWPQETTNDIASGKSDM